MARTHRHGVLVWLALAAMACTPRPSPTPVDKALRSVPLRLELPPDLEPLRQVYQREVQLALDHVLRWFARHGFPRKRVGIVDHVVVFGSAEQMKRRLARRFKMSPDKISDTFSATVHGRTLLVVREEMFKKTYAALYPRPRWDTSTYQRLMAHELAHRVHAMIATELFGTEDGMGPRWFFEGLAITCAGQFPGVEEPYLTWEQLAERVERDNKGIHTYPVYKRMFRSLVTSFPVERLIRTAGKEGFFQHLKKDYLPWEHVLEHPSGQKPLGSILLIHGSAPFNVNGRIPVPGIQSPYAKTDFYKDLSAALRAAGWSVLRYTKPGVYRARLDRDAYALTDYALLARQLRNMWRFLPRDRPRLVFAWSEGSLHVRALPMNQVDGVVLLGGISTNIGAVIQAQGGPSPATLKKMLASKKRTDMLGLDRPVGRLLDELAMSDNTTTFAPHRRLPLLVLHGTADREVPVAQARKWKALLPGHRITVVEGKGRDHRFMLPGNYDVTEIVRHISRWARRVVLNPSR